ncbi:hypothetical protein [Rhodococcoides kroppenstedtii]|uniref:hypothetical protein n=1 Tax=Rhodococcoides kroppenstedtii TaxID=293050 RepID=UPI0028E574F4|nr:hypothetical protein [Rhodococcus kroppenstedtii]
MRWSWLSISIFALVSVWVAFFVERFGFNPTDQGFVLAQSWRVLQGEIPHRDFISARPLGSAFFHVVDIVLPGPSYPASVVIATLQMMAATVWLALLTLRVKLDSLRFCGSVGVVVAALVNIHLFPMNAWHTIDGIFLVALGWWALDRGARGSSTWLFRLGLLALGAATTTKQSFAPALVAGLIFLLIEHRRGRRDRLLLDLAILAACPALYAIVVGAANGGAQALDQLTGGAGTVGDRLLSAESAEGFGIYLVVFLVACAVAAWTSTHESVWATIMGRCGAAASLMCVLAVVVRGGLSRAGDWGIVLLWMLVLAIAFEFLKSAILGRARVQWRLLALPFLAWMSSLSWGYDSPTLLGGSMALSIAAIVVSFVSGDSVDAGGSRLVGVAASVVGVLLSGSFLVAKQSVDAYRDQPRELLTASLGSVTAEMRGIRTTPATVAYLADIDRCVRTYPARKVAVLPDNAVVYPALNLTNPFPIDWMLPMELVADTRDRILDTATEMDSMGSYLVLFAGVTPEQLAGGDGARGIDAGAVGPQDPTGLLGAIDSALNGSRITCGTFTGIWKEGV